MKEDLMRKLFSFFFGYCLFLCTHFTVVTITEHFLKSILITSPVPEKAKEIKIKFPLHYKGFKDKFLKDFPMGDA